MKLTVALYVVESRQHGQHVGLSDGPTSAMEGRPIIGCPGCKHKQNHE
uniref:Transposase n=1 Tax=Heterorhabditis bacteriophora TaxID=37862 RepID=A0A1I7WTG5_HETBA